MPNRRTVSLVALLAAGLTLGAGCSSAPQDDESTGSVASALTAPSLNLVGRYQNAGGAIEISAFDKRTKRLFSVNSASSPPKIEVIDISNPANPTAAGTILEASLGVPNSVAIHKGLVAVAWEAIDRQQDGTVVFYDADTLATLGSVTVGAIPDMVTFTNDGSKLLVANEGEPAPDYAVDPEGSVTIIDVKRRHHSYEFSAETVHFLPSTPVVNPESVRVFGGGNFGSFSVPLSTPAQDYEPEYITVSDDGRTAWVTLQENNAIAVLDIKHARFTKVVGLGFKDHSLPGNGLDPSDRDGPGGAAGPGNINTWPIKGMYMPDSIGHFKSQGQTYLVTANEGDAREWGSFVEESRVSALVPGKDSNGNYLVQPGKLCPDNPAVVSGAASSNAQLGRLTVTTKGIPVRSDGCFPDIYSFGARSFSIRDTNGNLVFDSGDQIEQKIHELLPGFENSDQSATPNPDTRSDNKGPEPEGVAVAKICGRQYAFIGLERIGGVMMYDVTNPHSPSYVTYVNNRVFTPPTPGGDLGPEGLMVISGKDSPTHKPILVVSNEISGSASLYQIDANCGCDHDDD